MYYIYILNISYAHCSSARRWEIGHLLCVLSTRKGCAYTCAVVAFVIRLIGFSRLS